MVGQSQTLKKKNNFAVIRKKLLEKFCTFVRAFTAVSAALLSSGYLETAATRSAAILLSFIKSYTHLSSRPSPIFHLKSLIFLSSYFGFPNLLLRCLVHAFVTGSLILLLLCFVRISVIGSPRFLLPSLVRSPVAKSRTFLSLHFVCALVTESFISYGLALYVLQLLDLQLFLSFVLYLVQLFLILDF